MKSISEYMINEGRRSSVNEFKSKKEFMQFIDDIEQTKKIMQEYENKADISFKHAQKLNKLEQDKINKIQKETGAAWDSDEVINNEQVKAYENSIKELMKEADEFLNTPEYLNAQQKLIELRDRALDSLTAEEKKQIKKRGGQLYNILLVVTNKYMGLD